ncbi:hypothetical protein GJ629_12645 [Halapricum sp. CBA1109]|uniref:hypothetical protein n=1 Tax=Halapricum sp. CBA1109 TaxID=2668068 RepID=UPI0012FA439E|nr:hypothetical protein [Halapricum sp. CBA1109]MUV90640.1 hypothetical protein [Halapricum sp. CBA1109]
MRDSDDPITTAVLSGSTYERLRATEGSLFTIRPRKAMAIQALLLAVLALVAPMYLLFPTSVGPLLPTTDPITATPKLLVLGLFGWGMEVVAAVMMVGLYRYRTTRQPLSESQARTIFDVERISAGLSIVTGGLAIAFTVGIVSLGVGGESTLGVYLESVAGGNIFEQLSVAFSVAHLSIVSIIGAGLIVALRGIVAE